MNSRLDTLLKLVKQEFRKVKSFEEIDKKTIFNCDYKITKNIVNLKREEGLNFLQNALGDEKNVR